METIFACQVRADHLYHHLAFGQANLTFMRIFDEMSKRENLNKKNLRNKSCEGWLKQGGGVGENI